jgi:hypothetical protein
LASCRFGLSSRDLFGGPLPGLPPFHQWAAGGQSLEAGKQIGSPDYGILTDQLDSGKLFHQLLGPAGFDSEKRLDTLPVQPLRFELAKSGENAV